MIAFLGKWLKKKEQAASPAPVPVFTPPPNGAALIDVPSLPQPANDLVELSRIDIMQRAWGEGFSKPGSETFIVDITSPMRLDSSKTMLDLQAGLGGPSLALIEAYKTWISGFDRDPEIVEAWKKVADALPEKPKYDINAYNPVTFDYEKRVDGILARELIFTMADKNRMMKKIAAWLKPKGHLVITDFAAEKEVANGLPVAKWATGEKDGVSLISPDEMATLLLTHGFDLRVSEDITQNYQREIRMGLAKLTQSLEGMRLNPATKARVAEFAEFWAHRAAAIGAGVKFLRYYAIKKG